jgi:sugar phosphate isomerase/epimerase
MEYSFQLYSARNISELAPFFPELKRLGYTQVEGYGAIFEDVDDLALALEANRLRMPTSHFGLDQLQDISATLKIARRLGINTLICPFVPPQQRSSGNLGWQQLAQILKRLGNTYANEGLNLGWHNHDFEFTPTAEGAMPIDLILEGAPDIVWQCDVAWVAKSGQDPLYWIERHAARIASVHVKDIAPAGQNLDEDGWADLGEGVLDWQGLFKTIREKTVCNSFVLEHDNPGDVMRFASRSIAAARRLRR